MSKENNSQRTTAPLYNNYKITFPILLFDKYYYMDIWQTLDEEIDCSLYGYTKGFWKSIKIFDAKGMEWSIEEAVPTRKVNVIERILAPICYNPKIKVKLKFKNPKPYVLEKIKKGIVKIVKNDDDVYTQFTEGKDIIEKINVANTFLEIIDILKETKAIDNK